MTIEGRQNLPRFQTESTAEPTLLTLVVTTRKALGPLRLRVWTQRGESGPRLPLARDQLLLPWTPASPPAAPPLENVPDLAGGDSRKGAAVFASNEAKCASCHKVRGQGGDVGPDLSTLVGRDRTEVYRDIFAPSDGSTRLTCPTRWLSRRAASWSGRSAPGGGCARVTDTEAKVTVVPAPRSRSFAQRHVDHAGRTRRRDRRAKTPRPDRLPHQPVPDVTGGSRGAFLVLDDLCAGMARCSSRRARGVSVPASRSSTRSHRR